ncbi:MAG: hypothetical protein JWM76_369, partial [Pseudonocardiales bacterium]|nr:hypothetical protein [Pseudonocardiales bacterium]
MPKSIAHQSEIELGGAGSILVRQRRDHVRLDELLKRVSDTSGIERDSALLELARLVFPHAFAEESVLWPLARRLLDGAEELTTEIEQEHQRINELWSELEKTEDNESRYASLLRDLAELLRQDVRDEEDRLLPLLQESLQPAQLRRVGLRWEVVRRTAPTRPHAVVSRRPPGNVLAA